MDLPAIVRSQRRGQRRREGQAPHGGRKPPTYKTRVMSTRRRVPTSWVSGRTLQPSIESVVANSFVPSDFLVDSQVSGLGTVHPLLILSFFSTWILPLHVVVIEEEVVVIRNGWTPKKMSIVKSK